MGVISRFFTWERTHYLEVLLLYQLELYMPIRHNITMSASCCVAPLFCSQTCPVEAGSAPEPWRGFDLFFFWRSSQAVVLLKTLLNHFSFVSSHTDLLSGLSVLPCSCNSLTATSLCTTWGTEVDMASHFCTTSYSWDTWGQTILQLLYS